MRDKQPGEIDARPQVCQPVRHALELADGLAELHAVLRMLQRQLQRGLGRARHRRGHGGAGEMQRRHQMGEAAPFLAQQRVLADLDLIQADIDLPPALASDCTSISILADDGRGA